MFQLASLLSGCCCKSTLNITLITLTAFIIPLLIYFKPEKITGTLFNKNIANYNNDENLYINNLLLLEFFLFLLFLVNDLFIFYILYEALLIPMFILIIRYGSISKKIEAAYKFFIFTLAGSLLMLFGILFIYINFKTFDLNLLSFLLNKQSFLIQSILWFSFIFSFLIKIPTFPFHIWLPFAHVQAPTSASILLAALLLKVGFYGIIKFNHLLFFFINTFFSPIIILLALISILNSLLIALRLIDLKQIIAYSSIIHMNIFLIGFYCFNNISIQGSLLSLISHGLISSALFFLIGILYNRYHSRVFSYFRGLCSFMPLYSFFFFLSILANISIPVACSFIGEYLILLGSLSYNVLITSFLFLILILSSFYSLWLINRLLFGQSSPYLSLFNDLSLSEFLILSSLIFFTYFFGFFSYYLLDFYYLYSILILL